MHTNTKPGDRVNIGPKGSDNPPLSDVVSSVLKYYFTTRTGMSFARDTGKALYGEAYATPAPARETIG